MATPFESGESTPFDIVVAGESSYNGGGTEVGEYILKEGGGVGK